MAKDIITAGMASTSTATDASLRNMKKGVHANPKKAWEAAQKFENMVAGQCMQQLFSDNKTGLFGGGRMEVVFRSVLTENIANQASLGLKIAESVYPILLKNQGADG